MCACANHLFISQVQNSCLSTFLLLFERNIFYYGGRNLIENASKKAVLMKQTMEAT
jgi:hypothetical protein